MTVRVKICGITRGVDVETAVAAGADALGFVFTPRSPRVLDAATAQALVMRVPAFVCRVGLFMDQDAAEVGSILGKVPLSLLQFHGSEDATFCRSFGLPYVKALGMGSGADAALRAAGEFSDAAALLLDSHEPGGAGGTGTTFDWNAIPALGRPLVLAGGLTPDNVARAVAQVRPWAVDVSSGVEDDPGIKNAAKIRRFIQEARREQRSSET